MAVEGELDSCRGAGRKVYALKALQLPRRLPGYGRLCQVELRHVGARDLPGVRDRRRDRHW